MKRLASLLLLCAPVWSQVPYDRIVNAGKEPGNWLTYSGNYQGHRYSPLSQITTANVGDLRVKWAYQMDSRSEVSPKSPRTSNVSGCVELMLAGSRVVTVPYGCEAGSRSTAGEPASNTS